VAQLIGEVQVKGNVSRQRRGGELRRRGGWPAATETGGG
jgi:hypothetical protein